MSDYAFSQRQQRKKISTSMSSSSILQPVRDFAAPEVTPDLRSVASNDWQTGIARAGRSGHSIGQMAIHRDEVMQQVASSTRQRASTGESGSELQQDTQTTVESETGERREENRTGLPDSLKAGVEGFSGYSLDNIRVHYNSPRPAETGALAYTQGTEIHVGPGQEQHLPHEAWHVVQQMQGRVRPTLQAKGALVNDDPALESEADLMGDRAAQAGSGGVLLTRAPARQADSTTVQYYSVVNGWKISQSNVYKINTKSPDELYVLQGSPGPQPANKFTLDRTVNGYDVYKFTGQFENDCLGFAEYLSTGQYSKKPAFRSKDDRPDTTDRLFGVSDKQNINIAEAINSLFSKAEEANPDVGEAYVTIRRAIEDDECPFHVAYVVASDGNDRVTCEADAGSNMNAPVFDMYAIPAKKGKKRSSVAAQSKNFHEVYEDDYTATPTKKQKLEPTTGVLTPREGLVTS